MLVAFSTASAQNVSYGFVDNEVCWNGDSTILQVHYIKIGTNGNIPFDTKYFAPDETEITTVNPSDLQNGQCGENGGSDSTSVDFQPVIDKLDSILQKLNDTMYVKSEWTNMDEFMGKFDSLWEVRNLDTLPVKITDTVNVRTGLETKMDSLQMALDSIKQCLKDSLTVDTGLDSLLQEIRNEADSIKQLLGDTLTVNASVDFSDFLSDLDSIIQLRNMDTLTVRIPDTVNVRTGLELKFDSLQMALDSIKQCLSDSLVVDTGLDSLLQELKNEADSIKQLLGDTLTINASVDFSDFLSDLDSIIQIRNLEVIDSNRVRDSLLADISQKLDSLNFDFNPDSLRFLIDSARIVVSSPMCDADTTNGMVISFLRYFEIVGTNVTYFDRNYYGQPYTVVGIEGTGSCIIPTNCSNTDSLLQEILIELQNDSSSSNMLTDSLLLDISRKLDSLNFDFNPDSLRFLIDSARIVVSSPMCDADTTNGMVISFLRYFEIVGTNVTYFDRNYYGQPYTVVGIEGTGSCVIPTNCSNTDSLLQEILIELQNDSTTNTTQTDSLIQELINQVDSLRKEIDPDCPVVNSFSRPTVDAANPLNLVVNTYNSISIIVKQEPVFLSINGSTPELIEIGEAINMNARECEFISVPLIITATGGGVAKVLYGQ